MTHTQYEDYPNHHSQPVYTMDRTDRWHRWLTGPESKLCLEPTSNSADVTIKDLFPFEKDMKSIRFTAEHDLESYLQILKQASVQESLENLPDITNTAIEAASRPVCRFIFLSADSGRDRLNVTTKMLQQILGAHQVSPSYLEYLALYGERDDASDPKFGKFWCRNFPDHIRQTPKATSTDTWLGSNAYQLCYNIKGVESGRKGVAFLDHWSIRHAAIHHQFDIAAGRSCWIITKAGTQLRDKFSDSITKGTLNSNDHSTVEGSLQASFDAHLLVLDWATENWWRYVNELESEPRSTVNIMVKRGLSVNTDYIIPADNFTRQNLSIVLSQEEKADEAAVVLETNIAVLVRLKDFYSNINGKSHETSVNDVLINQFVSHVEAVIQDFENQRIRATSIAQNARNQKSLILTLMQAQNSDNMSNMAKRSTEEAMAMRVITVVTLVFLPATFVSTFFSTDVVKYQNMGNVQDPDGTSFSHVALMRWLQVVLPLTALTLAGAAYAYMRARRALSRNQSNMV